MNPRAFTRLGFILAWLNLGCAIGQSWLGHPGMTVWHSAVFLVTLRCAHASKRWHPPE